MRWYGLTGSEYLYAWEQKSIEEHVKTRALQIEHGRTCFRGLWYKTLEQRKGEVNRIAPAQSFSLAYVVHRYPLASPSPDVTLLQVPTASGGSHLTARPPVRQRPSTTLLSSGLPREGGRRLHDMISAMA